ncbi:MULTISPECIES: hypothetical protein [Acetobacteraceae]|uniref:hypothetical protein n=1 Tax=Acetobacteraceae TaxID=433 RepID=UPI002012D279|nr:MULTISPECIES: hypothetical protein [Acetobacteraceae]MCL1514854.1 hypothetical protein [Parasaccharibacter sp. TMW2.1890]MCL1561863.1 hypothetical protein [Parasaccharibacter sp. TMW 2.1886]MCT6844802.1 hypothetical protein [Bombella apis]
MAALDGKPSQELSFGIKVIYPPPRGFDENLTDSARGLFLSFCLTGEDPDESAYCVLKMRFLDGVKILPADWASIIPQSIIL